ncbi:hypothetical protein DNK57_07610 [Methanothermobacter thermautotrophicus]|uniref:Cell division protein SepF n=1 Tax=Methanothermobacter thermautotrophicus TaxID=145262 RepID=A0A842YM36_METTF|nr:cell division protein SepF [Methanothermobacter thermautotrophicus]MBE2900652.1 hypothetical protein [Methanothermobacter thermautotrophicus]MCQ8905233.1 cell division protein SepF [Methanothermobacter sp.]
MRDILEMLKKSVGLDEEVRESEETETIIVPEHSFYEIILLKAGSLGDVEDALSQVTEEKNPVILDLTEIQRDSPEDFKAVGERIKDLRENHGAEAILLCNKEKNVVIITPREIKLIRKG